MTRRGPARAPGSIAGAAPAPRQAPAAAGAAGKRKRAARGVATLAPAKQPVAPAPVAEARPPEGRATLRPKEVRLTEAVGRQQGPPRKAPQAPGIAFLDFDNTVIHGDAGPLFGWYLFLWRRHELEGHPWHRMRLWLRYMPYATWMGIQAVFYQLRAVRRSQIVRAAYKGLRGVHVERFLGLMEQFADEVIVQRIYPGMVEEVRGHMAAGRRCVVVTTGIEPLVRHVLDRIAPGMELIGCRMRTRDGRLTGRVDGPLYGVDKANIIHAYARALGVEPADCWAYSDHLSDRQMLEAVGHPVAVNPRGRFRRLARSKGWRVLELSLPPSGAS